MKRLGICVFVFVAIGTSGANTYVGPRIPNSSCSSSANLVLTVLSSTEGIKDVRVDIYREVENGERMAWTGVTGSDGTLAPPALSPGIYRVAADAGDRSGEMDLFVGQFKGTTKCNLKVALPYNAEAGTSLSQPSEVQLQDFRGVVVDEKGTPIPYIIVRIMRNGSSEGYLAQFQSDDKGKFEFHVAAGSYSAIFSYQGYRTRLLEIDVGRGWQGCKLSMVPEDSSLPDTQPTDWTSAPLRPNEGSRTTSH